MVKSRVQQVLDRIMKYKKYFRCEVEILKNYNDLVVLHVGYDESKDDNPTDDTYMIVIGEDLSPNEFSNSITIFAVKEDEGECYEYFSYFKNENLSTLDEELLELVINGYEAPEDEEKDIYYDSEGFAFDDDGNLYVDGNSMTDFDDTDYVFVDKNGKVIRA